MVVIHEIMIKSLREPCNDISLGCLSAKKLPYERKGIMVSGTKGPKMLLGLRCIIKGRKKKNGEAKGGGENVRVEGRMSGSHQSSGKRIVERASDAVQS